MYFLKRKFHGKDEKISAAISIVLVRTDLLFQCFSFPFWLRSTGRRIQRNLKKKSSIWAGSLSERLQASKSGLGDY